MSDDVWAAALAWSFVGLLMLLVLAAVIGWVLNIVKLAGMEWAVASGMFVLRCVGIIFAPLGAVLGWV